LFLYPASSGINKISGRTLLGTAVALDAAIVSGVTLAGPVVATGGLALLALILYSLLSNIGFVALVSVVSGFTVIGSLDFDVIRAAKWGLVSSIGLVAVTRLWIEGRLHWPQLDSVVKYFALYLCWGAISSIFAVHPLESFVFLIQKGLFLAIYLLAILLINSEAHVRIVLGIFIAYVLATGIYSFAGLATGSYIRFTGFLDNANGFGVALSAIVPMILAGQALFRKHLMKWLAAIAVVVGALCIALSWSRAAWVANFVAAIVFMILEKKKKALAIFIGVMVVLAVVVLSSSQAFSIFYQVARLRGGTTHRTTLWEYTYRQIAQSPLVGKGLVIKNAEVIDDSRGADAFARFTLRNNDQNQTYNPHNYYLETILNVGFPGLFIFLYFLYAILRDQIEAHRKSQDPRFRALSAAIISMVTGTSIGLLTGSGMIMGSGSYTNYFWISLGLVTAISRKGLLTSPIEK
jgi:O-antigen ligase